LCGPGGREAPSRTAKIVGCPGTALSAPVQRIIQRTLDPHWRLLKRLPRSDRRLPDPASREAARSCPDLGIPEGLVCAAGRKEQALAFGCEGHCYKGLAYTGVRSSHVEITYFSLNMRRHAVSNTPPYPPYPHKNLRVAMDDCGGDHNPRWRSCLPLPIHVRRAFAFS